MEKRHGRAPSPTQNDAWSKGILLEPVRHGLEVDTGGGDPLGVRHEAVCEMAAVREILTHDPVVRSKQPSVDSKVCRGAAVGLDVDTPLVRLKVVEGEGARLGMETFEL